MEKVEPESLSADTPKVSEVDSSSRPQYESKTIIRNQGQAPSFIDLASFSYLETHKVVQSSAARNLDYTVRRSLRMVSMPSGIAQSYSILLPDPKYQRHIDVDALSTLSTVKGAVATMMTMTDPSLLISKLKNVIANSTGVAPAIRMLPIKNFSVIEGGRQVVPAWDVDGKKAPFELGDVPPAVETYIRLFNNAQFACTTDTAPIQGAIGRACQDFVIANIIKRTVGDHPVYCIDPTSVSGRNYNPRWIEIESPYSPEISEKMATVRNLLVLKLNRELMALKESDMPKDSRTHQLYALRTLEMYIKSLVDTYPDGINIYCGGFVPTRELYTLPLTGSQLVLHDLAKAFRIVQGLKNVSVEVISVKYDDPTAPEPYFADLYGEYLDFAAQMIEFTGTSESRCAVAKLMSCTSISDRYLLHMQMQYWQQAYLKGSLNVGGHSIPMLIPDYGVSSLRTGPRIAPPAFLGADPNMVGDDVVSIKIDDLIGSAQEMDPASVMDLPFRTTESPLNLCVIEERCISPYLIGSIEDTAEISHHFEQANLVARTLITPYTYMGTGFMPYRNNKAGSIFPDTGMFQFNDQLIHYFDDLADASALLSADDPFMAIHGVKSCYIPLGGEQTRRGGVTMEQVNTYYCIRITNPSDEMTLTGDTIVEWTPEIQDVLQWQAVQPISRTTGPYLAR